MTIDADDNLTELLLLNGMLIDKLNSDNHLAEINGALQSQLDNTLRERDALTQAVGSLQDIVVDLQVEVVALKRKHLLLGRGDWDAKDWLKGVTSND